VKIKIKLPNIKSRKRNDIIKGCVHGCVIIIIGYEVKVGKFLKTKKR